MYDIAASFIIALSGLFLARKLAKKIGLVDKPNFRKKHSGEIPLVGGISIILVLLFLYIKDVDYIPNYPIFIISSLLLLIIGVIDDRFDLPVLPRIINQLLISIIMLANGYYLNNIGSLLVDYDIAIGMTLGGILTFLAVVVTINAYNMVDGIDGLLGVLSIVTFSSFSLLFHLHNEDTYSTWCLCIVVSIIPFIILNSGLIWGRKFKVFMGDAGSTILGFTILWIVICATQSFNAILHPIDALWFIAIPVMDLVRLFVFRLQNGVSPFKPDREHLHHIFIKMHFSQLKVVFIVFLMAGLFSCLGIVFNKFNISENISLFTFIVCLIIYILYFNKLSRNLN